MAVSKASKILEVVSTKGFITASSTSTNTPLTNSIYLRPGTWLLIIKTPYASNATATCVLNISGGDSPMILGPGYVTFLNYGTLAIPYHLNIGSTISLVSGASATYSWDSSYLDRGGLCAIRVGD